MMARNLLTCESITSVGAIRHLVETNHNAFPVVNSNGRFVGLISRDFLIKLLEHKAFYKKSGNIRP